MSDLFAQSEFRLDPSAKSAELSKGLDWVFTQRKQDYLDQVISLRSHKSVAVRRKIAKNIEKLLPLEKLDELKSWQAGEGDRETFLALESVIGKIERGALHDTNIDARIYSVDEVVTILKQMVSDREYIIEGELGEYKPIPGGQVAYFNLKGSADDAINCMAMKFLIDRLVFPMNQGLKLRITGTFRIGKNVRLYFQVSRIELTGEGELLRNYLELKSKLTEEGLFDPVRKRRLPSYPTRILLIASPNSAALTDFTKVFHQRRGGAIIFHLPIKTQGVGAEEEILEALVTAGQVIDSEKIETVVMTRGGGSSEDLVVFNSERIVRALFALKSPTVVAIGHERDTTLVELAADMRCSTPSQAAEKTSLSRAELSVGAGSLFNTVTQSVVIKLRSYTTVAEQLWNMVVRLVQQQLGSVHIMFNQIIAHGLRLISAERFSIKQETDRLVAQVKEQYTALLSDVKEVGSNLVALDPKQVLKRGYSLATAKDGSLVDTKKRASEAGRFALHFSDGEVSVTTQPS